MGFLTWMGLGLVVGIIAKVIMPGKDPDGLIPTMLIGVAGAFVGGFGGSLLGLGTVQGFDRASLALSIAGAVGVLWARRRLGKK